MVNRLRKKVLKIYTGKEIDYGDNYSECSLDGEDSEHYKEIARIAIEFIKMKNKIRELQKNDNDRMRNEI